ncbi:13581_t:CDS:1 [Cetraspora pellucida]|uniref:13581_t:CDS:1 n=1 Tax=Cetraspora pellucida TaxID=1433469 RepID=A0A9N9C326_9GLOM|nr:13581_t:CDS:1 [Cetraspora pellucida]
MIRKHTYLTPYAILLIFYFLTTSLAIPAPITERSHLLKRGENEKKCPCTYIHSEFDGVYKGEITLIQEENGGTSIFGLFSKGFEDDDEYTFYILDDYGKPFHDMTKYLNIKFVNGGTEPFSAKIPDLNIDCGDDNILSKHVSLEKRACKAGDKVAINKKGSNTGPTTGKPTC